MKNERFLFISHDATQTGAPVVLLSFLRWLKENENIRFDILLLKDGPLRKDFEDISKTYFIPSPYKHSLVNKVRRRLHPELTEEYKITEVINKLNKNLYTLIYGNTIVSLPWLLQFKKSSTVKVVCAIHELTWVIECFYDKEYVVQQLPSVDLIIAGSLAVAKNLTEEYKITPKKIKVVHAFINTTININKSTEALKQELGINDNVLVIGAVGFADFRKGIDLIVPLAVELKNNHPEVLFKLVWVGGLASDNFIKFVKQDAKKCGVEDHVIFIENTSSSDDYINLYDVFVLLSREDPFPLVILTAANMQKAIIAFDKSGGAAELLSDGAGFLAPYLSVEVVAEIISALYHNPETIKQTGKKAKDKVEREFSAGVIPARATKILHEL